LGINEKVGGIRCELAIGDGWGALSRRNHFMSETGQSRHSDCVSITSGLPRKADKFKAGPDFAKVPTGEMLKMQLRPYVVDPPLFRH
jgi:hypothetical protein